MEALFASLSTFSETLLGFFTQIFGLFSGILG